MADMKLRELQHLVDSKIIKYAHEFNIANDFRELSKQIDMLAEEQSNPAIEAQEAEIKRLRDEIEELKIENQNLELAVDMNMNLNIKKVELAIKNCEGKTAQAALAEKGE